jgi:FixJ family two-component response regulator
VANAARYVAVVDDDASVRIALGRLLRLAGYDVSTFESGTELLELLERRVPECLLLDVHLPGLSGFDVQSRLRTQGIDPPVVFITASDDVALVASAREAGGVRLLRKPFSNDVLLEAVRAALQR